MAEKIPVEESISEPTNDPLESPPEPTLGLPRNNSLSASIRAERGSPTPEVFEVDSLPEIPTEDPSPSLASNSTQANPPGSVRTDNLQSNLHPIDPQADQADSALLAQLIELGFDDWTSKLALRRTYNSSVEAAVNWIIERTNESDFESSPSSDEEDQPEEMGAAQSGQGPSAGFDSTNLMRSLARNARTHKMVFVANMGLKMGTGKLAAQVGHACLGLYQKAIASEEGRNGVNNWERLGAVKIVVKGESTEQLMELFKQAKDAGCTAYLVQDAGYTQIPAGSRTVLGVFGPVEAVDSVTGTLKLL